MEELIKQGAAHEAKDNRGGYTPLHLAADAGQCEVISRLCEMGAHLEAVSTKGWTPLALANMKVRIAACCEPAANMLQLAESARASRCFYFTVTDTVCKDYSVLRLDVMQCVCVLSMPHCLMCCPGLSLIILYRNTCRNHMPEPGQPGQLHLLGVFDTHQAKRQQSCISLHLKTRPQPARHPVQTRHADAYCQSCSICLVCQ